MGAQALHATDGRRFPFTLRLVLRFAAGLPEVWGEQTDVAESGDWFKSNFIAVVGSNALMRRARLMRISWWKHGIAAQKSLSFLRLLDGVFKGVR
ncbi:MAG: hypothetical protein IPH10_11210 [bacterium]|nr:hypothetical protein [bacterium]